MKIRCTECSKKISIDDAFAGGICRCPYCSATVPVSGKPSEPSEQVRPATPTSRPATPEVAAVQPIRHVGPEVAVGPAEQVQAADAAGQEQQIPVATPVMIQGLFAMALLGILVVMVIGGGVVMVMNLGRGKSGKTGNGNGTGELLNPFVTNVSRPAVAGSVPLAPPVIYVVPVSSSMGQVIDYASEMTKASIRSLRSGKFSILLCGEKSDEFMADGYTPAGTAGIEAAAKFLESAECRGAGNVARAIEAAQARNPKTIVLLTRGSTADMEQLGNQARQSGVLIITIALDASEGDRESQAGFAKSAGGQSLSYTLGELRHYLEAAAGE